MNKFFCKILAASFFALCLIFFTSKNFSAITIEKSEDLVNYLAFQKSTSEDAYLTQDIELELSQIKDLCYRTSATVLNNKFEGNGHTIILPSTELYSLGYNGIFSIISEKGSVQNLNITGYSGHRTLFTPEHTSCFNGYATDFSNGEKTQNVICHTNKGTICNCTVNCHLINSQLCFVNAPGGKISNVKLSGSLLSSHTGFACGIVYLNRGIITHCVNSQNIYTANLTALCYEVGGITCFNKMRKGVPDTGVVKNCSFKGVIGVESLHCQCPNCFPSISGIVSTNNGNVFHCNSLGTILVSVYSSRGVRVAGVIASDYQNTPKTHNFSFSTVILRGMGFSHELYAHSENSPLDDPDFFTCSLRF